MDKFVTKVNGLITKIQAKCISRCAKILMLSDKHDEYFFECCAKLCDTKSTKHIVPLGSQYVLVKHTAVATKPVVTIYEEENKL